MKLDIPELTYYQLTEDKHYLEIDMIPKELIKYQNSFNRKKMLVIEGS